jgi:two-component system cell cycle response regulator DivK
MQQQTILVVDDDEPHRRLVYDLLSAKGYRVLLAENGCGAIDLARRKRPELILLDIRLPDMSGLEVARILKAALETRAIPIAAITALAMPGDERVIRENGCDAYMPKPIRIGRLYMLVSGLLGGPVTRERPDDVGVGI